METLEETVQSPSTEKRKKSSHVQEKAPKEKKNNKKKGKFSIFFNCMICAFIIGLCSGLFLLYGPYGKFRDWYITTAMTTMTHQYLATWFYSAETINNVLEKNKVIEVEGITDTNLINTTQVETTNNNNNQEIITYANEYEKAVLEKDPNHPEYKLIDIKEKNYEGYLAVVYDASTIHTMVTSNLNVSGQYVTTMVKNHKAVLAINGGGFEDPNRVGTGGTPLGITMADGKVITNSPYGGAGGMIGFDTNNKLVLGKVSVKQAKEMNVRDCVTCGPFLIINGKSSAVLGNGGWGTAPRTAIGQRQDGIVLMLVVDGRKVGMPGADMDDLIEIMERYGAYNAAALDGGTSTVMVENYEIINDPVNGSGVHKTRPIATAFGVILKED